MTHSQFLHLCHYWQKRLSLNDWGISYALVEPEVMDDPESLGECDYQLSDRTAHINILDPAYADPAREYDIESVIVHECLHCLGAGIDPRNKTGQEHLEYLINVVARELVWKKLAKKNRSSS